MGKSKVVKCRGTIVLDFDVDVEIPSGRESEDPDRLLREVTSEIAIDVGTIDAQLGEVVKKRLRFERPYNFRITSVDIEKKHARRTSARRSSRRR
jgi:hypothetical protein